MRFATTNNRTSQVERFRFIVEWRLQMFFIVFEMCWRNERSLFCNWHLRFVRQVVKSVKSTLDFIDRHLLIALSISLIHKKNTSLDELRSFARILFEKSRLNWKIYWKKLFKLWNSRGRTLCSANSSSRAFNLAVKNEK